MGAGHPRAGTELAPRICSAWRAKGSGGRGPGRGGRGSPRGTRRPGSSRGVRPPALQRRGREPGEVGGRRAHPQGGQVDVVQAAGGGWVAHGLHREPGPGAAHAPARLFRCRRRRFSPIGGSWGRAPPRLPRRTGRGRAGGRTDPPTDRSSRPRACNPRLPPLLRRRRVAAHPEGGRGNVTRARRVPPPPRRRHLRAGAGEGAKGAREDRGTARAWRERSGRRPRRLRSAPTSWRACAYAFPSLPLFFALSLPHFLLSAPLTPFLPFPSSFVCPAANQTTHLSICGGRGVEPNPLYY